MPTNRRLLKIGLFIVLVFLAGLLEVLGLVDWRRVLVISEAYVDRRWLPVVLIAGQTLLYALALPGTGLILIVGVLYETWLAALIIAAGGILGGMCAYGLAERVSLRWVKRIEKSRFYELLQAQGDLPTLIALRCLPMFPHSVINYAAGLLRISCAKFMISTVIGFTVKGYVYASALYQASHAQTMDELVSWKTLLPLLILVLMLFLAKMIRHKWQINRD